MRKSINWIVALILVLFISCACRDVRPHHKNDLVIPIFYANGFPVLEVQLNNKPAYFMLDCGSNQTMIDVNLAEEYKFTFLPTSIYTEGIGGYQSTYMVYGTSMKVGYLFKENFFKYGLDLAEYFSGISVRICGLLGADFMKSNGITIDFANRKLYIK